MTAAQLESAGRVARYYAAHGATVVDALKLAQAACDIALAMPDVVDVADVADLTTRRTAIAAALAAFNDLNA